MDTRSREPEHLLRAVERRRRRPRRWRWYNNRLRRAAARARSSPDNIGMLAYSITAGALDERPPESL